MTVTPSLLLNKLPTFKDEWIKLKKEQQVKDIIKLILSSHEQFASYYNNIALYFDAKTIEETCRKLDAFCKKYLKYKEESDEVQTVSLPTGLLIRGVCDCKGYASFCGGVLDALRRLTGKKIDWWYRFASYNFFSDSMHHVFIVVRDGDYELWLDPVPGAASKRPYWTEDRVIKSNDMLKQNIGSIGKDQYAMPNVVVTGNASIGKASITVNAVTNVDNLNFPGDNHKYSTVFNPYLGLSTYYDYGGDRNISNLNQLTDTINQLILSGPQPGHTVIPDFVKWVYDSSIRSWNFYYQSGVKPGFNADAILPADFPRPTFTDDDRLIFTINGKPSTYHIESGYPGNAEVHIFNAWLQDLVNNYAEDPWPVKPSEITEFSKGQKGNNFLRQTRAHTTLGDYAKELNKAINWQKDNILKISGSIPRNAFLSLVGINVFHWANHLQEKINAGKWPEMAKDWQMLGGNPDKFKNTIEHGSTIPATDENGNAIAGASIGVVAAAAWVAAAAPIVAILLKYLDKSGKAAEIASAAVPLLQQQFPDIDFTPLLQGLNPIVKSTGQQVQWYVDPADDENKGGGNNNMPNDGTILTWLRNNKELCAGGVFIGTMLLTKKKGEKQNYVVPLLAAGITWFALGKAPTYTTTPAQLPPSSTTTSQTASERTALIQFVQTQIQDDPSGVSHYVSVFNTATPGEIDILYNWVFNYVAKGNDVDTASPLYAQLVALDNKYQIFGRS